MDNCITANPDISGIGVRAAIYAQNLLCFMPVVAYLWDGTVSPDEMNGIKDQSIGMLSIAFAILISTIIQATAADGQPITGFHAAVILDLSWMNNTSTWIWFLLYAHYLSKADNPRKDDDLSKADDPSKADETKKGDWEPRCPPWAPVVLSSKACHRHVRAKRLDFHPVVVFRIANHFWDLFVVHIVDCLWDLFSRAPVLMLGSFHLSLMSAIGIWLWLNPGNFGTPMPCNPTLTIVGGPAPFFSHQLQIFSLAMYFLLLIPGINLLPPIFFFLALHILYNWFRFRLSWDRRRAMHMDAEIHTGCLVLGLVLLVVINIIFLVDIELTLSRNKILQSGGDGLWGFGQVLALLLLVLPLRDAWNALRDIQAGLDRVQQEFEEAVRETHILDRLQLLMTRRADPTKPIKEGGFGNSLQLAAYHGREDIVDFLFSKETLAKKHVIETNHSAGYGTALQAASANGQVKVVQQVLNLNNKGYVDVNGGHYGTAFCAACANGKGEVAELLLKEGADTTLYGEMFGPPLHIASLMGEIGIIPWLLEQEHRDLNSEWGDYGTALDVAVAVRESKVQELLRNGGLYEVSNTALSLHGGC
ncbi:ankyrin repeat-containing domain protein [Mycena olivaceomarginata]|nr:ankyrin repeat-containing domain protein [Mycena olivaceomarginata]